MSSGIIFQAIDESELKLNAVETAARLKTPIGTDIKAVNDYEKLLRETMNCRFSALRTNVIYPAEGSVDLGFGSFESFDLYSCLSGAKEAYIFAVTLGIEVDRLLLKLYHTSPSGYFITDALASSFAEAAADLADEKLRSGLVCTKRYSPGYGDFPLSLQPDVLKAVNASKLLGISLSSSLLMTPKKSVTAVMGIK